MLYDVVFGKTIKVNRFSITTEEDSRDGQEVRQRFRKVVYALYRFDEILYCKVPAVAIAGAGWSVQSGHIMVIIAYM